MNPIIENIKEFIEESQVASVCFVDEFGQPYCINCFYAFDKEKGMLVFKSSLGTNHHAMIKEKKKVAGTILPNEVNTLKIKGLQFEAEILSQSLVVDFQCPGTYYKKYPFALAMPGYIWAISLDKMKLTDNTLVFGKKEKWER
ncbi:MAG: pyridoxamine 5'-phosphate oxidase family protein [Bacteroidetes bacterium]|nr:pyridoxamine 5'-phosphate oxidase family protein [Bacteroidota bacterium]